MSINYRSSEVRFGDWISEGFRMFVEQWQVWVLQTLVLCGIILAFVAAFFGALMGVALVTGATQEPSALPLFVIFLPGFLIMWAASGALVSGMFKTAFKQLQGGKIQVSDIFSGMDCMPAVLLATFCNGILVMFGLLLCIIPGFIVAGLLYFTVRFRESHSLWSAAGAGLALFAGSLTRYEGWFLIPFATVYFFATARSRRFRTALATWRNVASSTRRVP